MDGNNDGRTLRTFDLTLTVFLVEEKFNYANWMREMDSLGTKGVRYSRLRDHFGIWTVLYGPRQGK